MKLEDEILLTAALEDEIIGKLMHGHFEDNKQIPINTAFKEIFKMITNREHNIKDLQKKYNNT